MFLNMENLKIISVISGPSSISRTYQKRPYHGLVFKISGESFYQFPEANIVHRCGEVFFIPQGAGPYRVSRVGEGDGRYVLINFTADLDAAQLKIYTPAAPAEIRNLMEKMEKELVVHEPGSQYECISMFYKILALLHTRDHKGYIPSDRSSVLAPAFAYLKDNLFAPSLRVETLHTLCGISDTYFRKIFKAAAGMSPKQYVLDKRLSHAKHILDSGEYNFIYEVAASVGFEDPLYFSKSFKAKYGCYPTLRQGDFSEK